MPAALIEPWSDVQVAAAAWQRTTSALHWVRSALQVARIFARSVPLFGLAASEKSPE